MVVLGKDDIELIEGSKGWMERLQKLKCNAESVGRLETEIVTPVTENGIVISTGARLLSLNV